MPTTNDPAATGSATVIVAEQPVRAPLLGFIPGRLRPFRFQSDTTRKSEPSPPQSGSRLVAQARKSENINPFGGVAVIPPNEINAKEANPMPKTKDASPIELTPTRQRLAALQSDLASVDSAVTAELARAANLDFIHEAVATTKSALAAFDNEQAAGMARWASSQTTGRPTSAGAQRAELVAEVADAEQSSAAATSAQEQFRRASIQAAAPLQRLRSEIASAAKLVVLEDAEILLPLVSAAIAHAEDLHRQLLAATSVVRTDMGADVSIAFGAFDDALRNAEARPHEPAVNPHLSAWRKLELALTQNAAITLEDAAALDLPGAPVLPNFDAGAQMQAEVAAIMSFKTTSSFK